MFTLSHSKQVRRLIQLDLVGFLGEVPRGIATAANLHGIVSPYHVVFIHVVHGGIDVGGLAGDGSMVGGLDVNMGQVGDALIVLGTGGQGQEEAQGERNKESLFHLDGVVCAVKIAAKVNIFRGILKKNLKIIAANEENRTFARRLLSRAHVNGP